MAYTINANAKNVWIRDNEDTRDLSIQTDASSVYLDNGRTLEQELGEGSMVSNVATVDTSMSKVIDGTYDGAYESCVFKGRSLVNAIKNYSRSGYGSLSDNIALLDSGWIRATATSSNNHFELKMDNLNIKPSTKYMYILECRSNTFSGNGQTFQFGDTYKSHVDTPWTAPHIVRELPLGRYTFILTTKSDFSTLNNPVGDRSYICVGNGQIEFRYMILEYQEGMENWNIPFFEGICDVKMPILRNVGKNLFDGDNSMELGAWKSNATHFETSSEIRCKNNFIPFPNGLKNGDVMRIVLSDTSISSNTNMHVYDASKTHIITLGHGASPYIEGTNFINGVSTITIHDVSKCKYFSFRAVSTNTECKFAIMVNTSAPYEDYKSNILHTSEEIVLRKVNGIQDTYNLLTGEYVRRIGEIVLDGSEDWQEYNTNVVNTYCGVIRNDIITDYKGTVYLNNKLNKLDDSDDDIEGIRLNNLKRIFVRINRNKGVTNLTEFKQYISQNPITVQYELVEPITTIVEPLTTPFAYQNGHVILESGSEEQSLLPTLEYSTVVNRTGQVESVAKVIQKQEKQLTMLEQMLIQNIIGLDYNNTVLALNLEINEVM